VLAGYASNNKYSLLGGLRAAAQTVSYEVFMGISIMGVVMLSGTFNLREIVEAQRDGWFIIPQFFGFIVFLIAVVAESRRTPLDLPEAEQELVAGFHTEYSGMKFGMFFVGEYLGITLSSAMIVTLRHVLRRRVSRHYAQLGDDRDAVFRRLAGSLASAAVMVLPENRRRHHVLYSVAGGVAAAPLRSTDGFRLESAVTGGVVEFVGDRRHSLVIAELRRCSVRKKQGPRKSRKPRKK